MKRNQNENFIDNKMQNNNMKKLLEIIEGNLLGDANIQARNGKYFYYKHTAKDRNFLEWMKNALSKFGIKSWITQDNKISNIFSLGFYINTCPYPEIMSLRSEWYEQVNGKMRKTVLKDLKLTSTILLHWYLGDGSLIRHKNKNRLPWIVLATNNFSKKDVDFLIEKLKELTLNFYPVLYKSGFTGKKCGYAIYSNAQDGTPLRFFKLIGLKCPKEIANCFTGRKGRGSKLHYFKDKWPNKEDLLKMFSNEDCISRIIKDRRKEFGLSKRELAELTQISRRHIRHIEFGDRLPSVSKFRKILSVLEIDSFYLLGKTEKRLNSKRRIIKSIYSK